MIYATGKKRKSHKLLILIIITVVLFTGYLSATRLFKDKDAAVSSTPTPQTASASETINQNILASDGVLIENITFSCGHTDKQVTQLPLSLVGKTRDEVMALHPEYSIITFDDKLLEVNVSYDNKCKNHYIIKLRDDGLYVLYNDGTNRVKKKLDIDISALTPSDITYLKDGILIESEEELLEYLEDFAS